MIEKETLKFKELEHVLIEKVEQLFRDKLSRSPDVARRVAPYGGFLYNGQGRSVAQPG